MSAAMRNVLLVMLRTPGERNNATTKIRRIVFTLLGDLNVNLFAINRSEKIHQDQDSQDVLHYLQFHLVIMQTALSVRCSKYQTQIAHKVLDYLVNPRRFLCAWFL